MWSADPLVPTFVVAAEQRRRPPAGGLRSWQSGRPAVAAPLADTPEGRSSASSAAEHRQRGRAARSARGTCRLTQAPAPNAESRGTNRGAMSRAAFLEVAANRHTRPRSRGAGGTPLTAHGDRRRRCRAHRRPGASAAEDRRPLHHRMPHAGKPRGRRGSAVGSTRDVPLPGGSARPSTSSSAGRLIRLGENARAGSLAPEALQLPWGASLPPTPTRGRRA
jgi:hypothetical protein